MSNRLGKRRAAAVLVAAGLASALLTGVVPGAGALAVSSAVAATIPTGDLSGGDQGPIVDTQMNVNIWAHTNGETVARDQVLARAAAWMNADPAISYNQRAYRDGYRTDCSGFVSMAWNLNQSLDTTSFVPTGAASWISKDQLAPGDALLNDAPGNDGHVVLFERWADSSHSSYVGYELTGSGDMQHRTIPYPYFPSTRGNGYRPVHAKNVTDSGVISTPSATSQQFFHNIRTSNGSWTGFAALTGVGTAPSFKGAEAAITGMRDGTAQLLGIGLDGNVYHETRLANGSWTGFAPLNGVGTATMQARKVAIAGMPDGTTQVLAIGNDGNVYHETRLASGSWTGFAPLNGVGTPTMQASQISIAGMPDGTTQVLAIGNDGNVYHETRLTSGSWTGFHAVQGYFNAATFAAQRVAIAGLPDGSSQILATGR